jgi:hypothetical protein
MKRIFVITFLILLIIGIETNCNKKRSTDSKDFTVPRYYLPLDKGNYWVFSHKSKNKTDTILIAGSFVNLSGKNCFLVNHPGNSFLSEGVAFALFREGKNIKAMGQKDFVSSSVLPYPTPFIYLIDTLITAGESWERYFYPQANSLPESVFTAAVTNMNVTITTQVGILFGCLEVTVSNQKSEVLFKEYYAPGIGWVKFLPLVWAKTRNLDTLEIFYYHISDIIQP